MAPPPERARRRRVAPWVTAFAIATITVVLAWRGRSFYALDALARTEHPEYALLRSQGLIGHGYGIVGTALILTNLGYLVRRRLASVLPPWVGSVRTWLDVHVVAGLTGSVLVVFHSTFQLRTPIATTTAASLGIVVVTGLVGLYLHNLLPRPAGGLAERLGEVKALLPALAHATEAAVARVPCTKLPADASFLRAVFTLPRWALQRRARRRSVRAAARADKVLRALRHREPELARDLAGELEDLAAADVDALAKGSLMRSWRSLHRFLALLMVVSVSVHISVAWFYGFRWIFSQ